MLHATEAECLCCWQHQCAATRADLQHQPKMVPSESAASSQDADVLLGHSAGPAGRQRCQGAVPEAPGWLLQLPCAAGGRQPQHAGYAAQEACVQVDLGAPRAQARQHSKAGCHPPCEFCSYRPGTSRHMLITWTWPCPNRRNAASTMQRGRRMLLQMACLGALKMILSRALQPCHAGTCARSHVGAWTSKRKSCWE